MIDFVIRLLAHVLVPMFAVGMVGSTVVVAITFMHDLVDFVADDDAPDAPADHMPRT